MKAGYVALMKDKEGLHMLQSGVCPQPCSTQLAELVALTKTCGSVKGKQLISILTVHMPMMCAICFTAPGRRGALGKQTDHSYTTMILLFNFCRQNHEMCHTQN